VVKQEQADGNCILSEFDNAGRLLARTDAAGRRTQYRLNVGSGDTDATAGPRGFITTASVS
jgi:YD repeat-containing protein